MSEREKAYQYALWLNLIIGIYNIGLYVHKDSWFSLIIGAINVGVWVFNRDKLK